MKPSWYKVIFTRIDRANDFIRLVHLTNDFLFMVPKPQSDNLRKCTNRILYTSYCVTLIQKPTIVKLSLISLLSILPLNSNNISAFWTLLAHFIKIRIWFYLLEDLFIQFWSYLIFFPPRNNPIGKGWKIEMSMIELNHYSMVTRFTHRNGSTWL